MSVHMIYDGVVLTMTITDSSVNKSFAKSWPVNIPSLIGGNNTYVGFTGGTGGQTGSQKKQRRAFRLLPANISAVDVRDYERVRPERVSSDGFFGQSFSVRVTGSR